MRFFAKYEPTAFNIFAQYSLYAFLVFYMFLFVGIYFAFRNKNSSFLIEFLMENLFPFVRSRTANSNGDRYILPHSSLNIPVEYFKDHFIFYLYLPLILSTISDIAFEFIFMQEVVSTVCLDEYYCTSSTLGSINCTDTTLNGTYFICTKFSFNTNGLISNVALLASYIKLLSALNGISVKITYLACCKIRTFLDWIQTKLNIINNNCIKRVFMCLLSCSRCLSYKNIGKVLVFILIYLAFVINPITDYFAVYFNKKLKILELDEIVCTFVCLLVSIYFTIRIYKDNNNQRADHEQMNNDEQVNRLYLPAFM